MDVSVDLSQMLAAREQRAFHQRQLLNQYRASLVCFTMNIAGPIKDTPLIRRGFSLGCRQLDGQFRRFCKAPSYQEKQQKATGCEAYYVVDMDAVQLKRITVELEDSSPLGRLFDMDVFSSDGHKIDRAELGMTERLCLVCSGPAKVCARSRKHSVSELQRQTNSILHRAVTNADASHIASLACRALLYEVCTSPKPGLVDRENTGSHQDMDIFTFMGSSSALWPYFFRCAQVGMETVGRPASEAFSELAAAGRLAEGEMLLTTNGVNTHKGAIFSVGLVCAAMGRLGLKNTTTAEQILRECSVFVKGLCNQTFAGPMQESPPTIGQQLYLQYGITGVRGQAEAGFPVVLEVGLPVLKQGILRGYGLNRSGCAALLHLLSETTDTNMIARSNRETQQNVCARLKLLVKETPYPDEADLKKLDEEFIRSNLSPGGSADLLALCYLLWFWEQEVSHD